MTGKIVDADTQQPIPFATVRTAAGQSVVANVGGMFSLDFFSSDTTTIWVQSLGYETANKLARKGDFLLIALLPNTQQLGEVVVTGYQQGRSLLTTAGSVSLLTMKDLRRDNDVILTPVLNRVPGVFMHSGALNTNRITIRGIGSRSLFSTNRIRAYFNDIPLTTGEGETTLEDIDMSLIGRAEVLKGPSSSLYGAGLGGTILLEAATAKPDQTEVESSFLAGSFGLRRTVNRLASGKGRSNLQLVHSYMESDGYRENNEYFRHSLTAVGHFFPSERTAVTFLGSVISLKSYIPSSIDSATFRSNPRAAATTWKNARGYENYQKTLMGISVQQELTNRIDVTASVFSSFRNADEPRPFNILREASQAAGARGRAVWKWSEAWKGNLAVGGEFFSEWYNWRTFVINNRQTGPGLSDNEEQRRYFNLFAQVQLQPIEKLYLEVGLNMNQTRYRLTDLFVVGGNQSGEYAFDRMLSPRVAGSYSIAPRVSVHGSIGHGFSPPSLSETLTPEGQINPDIQPETGMNYEAGLRGNFLQNRLFLDVTLYTMDVRNLLVARRVGDDAFVGVNAGKTRHNGVEFSGNWQMIVGKKGREGLQLFASYTFNDFTFRQFQDLGNDYSGNQLTGAPRHQLAAGLDGQTAWGIFGNINLQYTGEMPMRDDNRLYSDAYSLVNLMAGYRGTVARRLGIELSGGIQNAFDERYASMILVNALPAGGRPPRYYYPGLPRNYFGRISVRYALNKT